MSDATAVAADEPEVPDIDLPSDAFDAVLDALADREPGDSLHFEGSASRGRRERQGRRERRGRPLTSTSSPTATARPDCPSATSTRRSTTVPPR